MTIHSQVMIRVIVLFRPATNHGAGENIAMGYQSPKEVVRGWMNSPGHRENILSDYLHLGVGILKGGSGKYGPGDWFYWVQNFGVTGDC